MNKARRLFILTLMLTAMSMWVAARAERKLARQSVSFEGDAPAASAAEPAAEAAPPESEGAAADGGGGAEPPMQPLEC